MSDRSLETHPASAAEVSPAAFVPPMAVLPLLSEIERLQEGATGALVYGDQAAPRGAVLVEDSRVCWAATDSMRRRLTDILRHYAEPPLEARQVESLYEQCRQKKRPLGEYLVEVGALSERRLRRALRQHNTEAVASLAMGAAQGSWVPHAKQRYDARFTFSTAELFANLGALRDSDRAARARRELRALVGDDGLGVSFSLEEMSHALLPVGCVEADVMPCEDLIKLGEWAQGQLDTSHLVAHNASFITTRWSDGRGAIAWRRPGDVFHVVLCSRGAAHARVLSRLSRTLAEEAD